MKFPALSLFVIILISCNDTENNTSILSGEVRDAYSEEPVQGVEVTILEGGPSTTTDAQGNFAFADEEVNTHLGEDANPDHLAVALSHPNYRPRETNVSHGMSMDLEMAPVDVPVYFYYPPVQLNDGLQVGALDDVGMDRQQIQNMMDRIYRDDFNEIHSILVYREGQLVLEEYFFGNNDTIDFENGVVVDSNPNPVQWSRTREHYVASVNKALTSSIVGIALAENGVSVDEKVANYLPDYASYFEDENKAALSFHDCLTMTAGFQWDEWGANDLALLWKSQNFVDFVLERPNAGPGSAWVYNSALPNLLLKAVDDMVDGEVRQWAHANFYEKLGITDYKWQSQPDGFPEGAARMYIRPRDMLKVGITYLNNGSWNGEQVIPQAWVKECFEVKEETSAGDYSYYFWLREINDTQYLSADGDGGNFINIFPEENMVIVITQGLYLRWPTYVVQADKLMGDYILPSLEK